jgi:tetratricopeptide (TPR) repeat protein
MSNTNVEALCKLAGECLQMDQVQMAKELYDKVLTSNVDSIEAHLGLASIAYQEADYATTVEHYLKLTLLQPTESRNYTNLGAVYNQMGEYSKGVEVLRKAIHYDKRGAEAYYNLGIAQKKLKQWQQAISAYREATRLNPKMADAFQNLANVYVETSNVPMAIMNYKKALEIRPDFEKARKGLKKAEQTDNQARQAINPFGRLVDTETHQVSSAAALSREMSEAERYDDRHEVKKITEEIERISKESLEFLKQKLEPAILDVQRTMTEGKKANVPLVDVAEAYDSAVKEWAELRKGLKRKMLELRAHEELINAPEVNLQD